MFEECFYQHDEDREVGGEITRTRSYRIYKLFYRISSFIFAVCHEQIRVLSPQKIITDRSKAVFLLWLSVAFFGVRVSTAFHLMLVHINFSSVSVAGCPPFGKKLFTRLTICSLCNLPIFLSLVISRFGYEGGLWVLIAKVPCHFTLVTFCK